MVMRAMYEYGGLTSVFLPELLLNEETSLFVVGVIFLAKIRSQEWDNSRDVEQSPLDRVVLSDIAGSSNISSSESVTSSLSVPASRGRRITSLSVTSRCASERPLNDLVVHARVSSSSDEEMCAEGRGTGFKSLLFISSSIILLIGILLNLMVVDDNGKKSIPCLNLINVHEFNLYTF